MLRTIKTVKIVKYKVPALILKLQEEELEEDIRVIRVMTAEVEADTEDGAVIKQQKLLNTTTHLVLLLL